MSAHLVPNVKKIMPSVVAIAYSQPIAKPGANAEMVVCGTGFVISEKGYVCTCEHVVRGAKGQLSVGVLCADRQYHFAPAEIARSDIERDVSILRIPPPPPQLGKLIPVHLGASAGIEVGQEVAFCGFPFGGQTGGGFSPSVTRGIISAFRPRKVGELDLIHFQLDALTMEGNSGAPLFKTDDGSTVGMIGARFDPLMQGNIPQVIIGGRPLGFPTNIGFAIPSDAMKCVIEITIQAKTAQSPVGGNTGTRAADGTAPVVPQRQSP